MLAVAISDYAFQRWQYEKSLKMSRYEIKQELKETEGDPHIKARVRAIRYQQARQQMMREVEKAEVIITNPTHYAVALRYDPKEREAPHVVGKGMGLIAQRIKEIGLDHDIPLYEDVWLARTLYRHCQIGDTIPVEQWQAVAKVLAYVRTLEQKKRYATG
jgi:flagellar biosynthetic protein FlhB